MTASAAGGIVCYARGGGLGHLTRVRAYLRARHSGQRAVIVTDSPLAADPRVTGGHRVLPVPTGAGGDDVGRWLAGVLAASPPEELVVDAFPAGSVGELDARVVPSATRVVHLARLLRWDAYRPLLPKRSPRFDRTWLVEPVTEEHRAHLEAVSNTVTSIEPTGPPSTAPSEIVEPNTWLIVHAGPAEEMFDLIDYARDTAALEGLCPRLTLVSPCPPDGLPHDVTHLDAYPARPLFPAAGRIITAAGCNAVHELAPWRRRHRMVPFPRRFDDQFTRAARARGQNPVPSACSAGPRPLLT